MLRFQAYRYEVMPNGEQRRRLRRFAGSARYGFNRALAIHYQEREKTGRKQSGYGALCRMLTKVAQLSGNRLAEPIPCPHHTAGAAQSRIRLGPDISIASRKYSREPSRRTR